MIKVILQVLSRHLIVFHPYHEKGSILFFHNVKKGNNEEILKNLQNNKGFIYVKDEVIFEF